MERLSEVDTISNTREQMSLRCKIAAWIYTPTEVRLINYFKLAKSVRTCNKMGQHRAQFHMKATALVGHVGYSASWTRRIQY